MLILAMTAEWSQRTAMSTFTLEPRRGRVLTAKIVTGLGVSLAAAAIVTYLALGAVFTLLTIPALKAGRWVNAAETYGWVLNGQWSGHGAQIAASTALWIILPLTLGLVRTLRREVR